MDTSQRPVTCPLCRDVLRMAQRARPLYGVPICWRCRKEFANRRQVAFVVDVLLCLVVEFFLLTFWSALGVADVVLDAPGKALLVLFIWFKDGFLGMSPGRALLGLQVVHEPGGGPIGLLASLKRNLLLVIPVLPPLVAFQLYGGPRWGDGWAKTRVIWRTYRDRPPFLAQPQRVPA
jgi:hypothetical protein